MILEKWTNVFENCLASLKSLNLPRNTVKPILLVFINWAMNLKIKTTKYSINKVTLFGILIFNAKCIHIVCNNRLTIMSLWCNNFREQWQNSVDKSYKNVESKKEGAEQKRCCCCSVFLSSCHSVTGQR